MTSMKLDPSYLGAALRRRGFLTGSAALAALALLPLSAGAQSEARIHSLAGDVRVNGRRIDARGRIGPGDVVTTVADGYVLFSIGADAFLVKPGSELRLEPSPEPLLVTGLRLLTGALGAVFGPRKTGNVRIVTPTVTAGIRGTGCYVEARGESTYFCTCYGTIAMASTVNPRERVTATTTHHNAPQLFLRKPRNGSVIAPTGMETHTDADLETLEQAVGRRAPWAT
jgi:hypothetical protein